MFENTLFHLIRVIYQDHTARWAQRMPELTKPQYAVLEALDQSGPLDQLSLGQASATTRATMTEMLSRMEKKGLIQRKVDEHDGRQKLVSLTEAGRSILTEARPIADAVSDSFMEHLTPEESKQLLHLMQKLFRQTKAEKGGSNQ